MSGMCVEMFYPFQNFADAEEKLEKKKQPLIFCNKFQEVAPLTDLGRKILLLILSNGLYLLEIHLFIIVK